MPRSGLPLLGVVLVVAGCEAPPGTEPATEPASQPTTQAATSAVAPMDVSGEMDSNWEYLAGKYDADGDGAITAAEYDRGGRGFDRLDRDGDGRITEDDLGRGGGPTPEMMRSMRTQMVVIRYFQDDDDAGELSLAELERSIDAYDANGDGAIDAAEFADQGPERRDPNPPSRRLRMMMDGMQPYDTLADGVDDDGDGRLGTDELVAFFHDRDDGDLVWRQRGAARRGGGGAGRAMSGPAEGTIAPDFMLAPPEGGRPVTLSSFQGNLPVALIFGSYT
jgi:Ca2+-binding EF-hand superfamily protein